MSNSDALDQLFSALADATRRDMLSRLVDQDATIGDLAENYTMSLPAISKHLQVLQDAGLVSIHKEGRAKRVTLEPDNLLAAQIWLSTLSDESAVFDRLEDEIEALRLDNLD